MSEEALTILEVTRRWLDASHPTRSEALTALAVSTGMAPELVAKALDNAFAALDALSVAGLEREISAGRHEFAGAVIVVAPGNVFTAWLPTAVTVLLMGGKVWIKPPQREPVFPKLWS